MHALLHSALRGFVVAFLLAGCAATPNQPTAWLDPAYTGQGFRKIFVVGLSARDLTDQRGFENLMVSALQDAGVLAVPGWQFMPTDRTPDEGTIRAAVARSGADGVLLARISDFSAQSDLVAAPVVGYGPDRYFGGPGMYGGWYQPAVEVDYQRATVYTTLFDVQTANPVWTFNVPTFNPATVRRTCGLRQSGGERASVDQACSVRNRGDAGPNHRHRGFSVLWSPTELLGRVCESLRARIVARPNGHFARFACARWWPTAELNHRHKDFQSSALPTELLGQACEL